MAGKWQLNGLRYEQLSDHHNDRLAPMAFGFDDYLLYNLTLPTDSFLRYWNPTFENAIRTLQFKPNQFGPDVLMSNIETFIQNNSDTSFLIYYSALIPHRPLISTNHFESNSEMSDIELFTQMLSYLDNNISRIINALDSNEILNNTLIIFLGDNGTDSNILNKMQSLSEHDRQGKGTIKKTGTHVPLIMYWPERIKSPIEFSSVVDLIDVYSTIISAMGNHKIDFNGIDLLDPNIDPNDDNKSIIIHFDPDGYNNGNLYGDRCASTNTYKLYNDGSFYNIKDDYLESKKLNSNELSDQEKEVKRSLESRLDNLPKLRNNINPNRGIPFIIFSLLIFILGVLWKIHDK